MSRLRSTNTKKSSLLKLCLFIIILIITSIFVFLCFQNVFKPINITIQNQSSLSTKKTSVNISKQTIIPSKTHSIRCVIYIFRRSGRLGNRMFVIATAYALARLHSCHLSLSPLILAEIKSVFIFNFQSFLLPRSTLQSMIKNISNPKKRLTKDIGCQYCPELIRLNAISQGTILELIGFWQSYLHFANYRNELRESIFAAVQPILEKVSKFFINICQEKFGFIPQFSLENQQSFKNQLAQLNKTTWIGIHIRRTDFLKNQAASSDEYLFNALEYYTKRYPNAYFIVASDDKSYCKNLFRNRSNIFITSQSFSPGDDLITLSLCQHSIITGGTFGWWSAYLANGEVVYDTIYPTTCEKDEYYYPPWFKSDLDIMLYKNSS